MKFVILIVSVLFALLIVYAAPWTGNGNSGYNYNYNNYNGYSRGNGGYYPQQPRYNHGKSYGGDGGSERYKSISMMHNVDTLAFPGKVGNPVVLY